MELILIKIRLPTEVITVTRLPIVILLGYNPKVFTDSGKDALTTISTSRYMEPGTSYSMEIS